MRVSDAPEGRIDLPGRDPAAEARTLRWGERVLPGGVTVLLAHDVVQHGGGRSPRRSMRLAHSSVRGSSLWLFSGLDRRGRRSSASQVDARAASTPARSELLTALVR